MSRLWTAGLRRRRRFGRERFAAVVALVVAADRMRDDWAEGNDAVKRQLWRDLHTRVDELRDVLS